MRAGGVHGAGRLQRAGRALLVLGLVAGCASAGVDSGGRGFERKLAVDRRALEAADRDAVRVWTEQARDGDSLAQSRLGLMYELGRGVPRNYAEAARWYRAAARQGDAVAQFNLGNLYATGQGPKEDAAQAKVWYRKAARQGHEAAQDALAKLR